MKIENWCTEEDNIFKRLLTIFLKLLLISVPLFVNKYVYDFRVNQEGVLKIFTLILLAIWLVKIVNTGKYSLQKTKLDLPLILFILVMAISVLISEAKIISSREFTIFFSYILIFFLITNNIDKKSDFYSFIHLFFIISLLVSVYTIIQYYGMDLYLKDLHELTSTIGQKNWISNYLAMIFPVVFSYFLLEQTKKNKIIYFVLLAVLYTTLMICQSRGIWISISLTLIFAIYMIIKFNFLKIFQENKKWLLLLLITFLVITIIYSTDNPLNKSAITVPKRAISTFDEQDPSIDTRLLIWKTTLEMIKDRPIFGLGIGTFKMNYLSYQAEFLKNNPYYIKYSGKARDAHNDYLQVWAEIGIIGLGIFIGIILMFYSLIIDYLKKNDNDKEKIIVFGLILGITCFLIHSLFTFPLHVPALGVTFFALLGLTIIYTRKINLSKTDSDNKPKELKLKNKGIKIVLIILVLISMIWLINLVAVKPYIAELYYFKGMRYNVDRSYTKSLPNFQYAVQLDPYNGRILHALGTTYFNLNIFSKAEEMLKEAKKYMIDVNTFYILGLNYSKLNMFEKAEKEYKYAIYLDSKFNKAYIDLAYLYAKQEEYDKAIIEWNKILEVEPDFSEKYNVLYFIGLAYNKKGMPDMALEYFLEALQLAPEGSPIIEEIEKEIYNIYESKLEK
jgi:O-antigen ligase/Tfp pilus assembly protein PilF